MTGPKNPRLIRTRDALLLPTAFRVQPQTTATEHDLVTRFTIEGDGQLHPAEAMIAHREVHAPLGLSSQRDFPLLDHSLRGVRRQELH